MPISAICPSCGRRLRVADALAGREVKCPDCASAVTVRGNRSPDGEMPYEAPMPTSRVALGLGLAALVVGAIAVPLNWVPGATLAAWAVGGAGLFLGVVGVVLAGFRHGQGLAFPVAGSAVSVIALAVAGLLASGLQFSVTRKGEELVQLPTPEPAPPAAEEKPKPAEPVQWIDASKGPFTVGDVRVRLGMVWESKVRFQNPKILSGFDLPEFPDKEESQEKHLGIQVFIENRSESRKVDYRGWASGSHAARLSDDAGNSYKRITASFGSQIIGQVVKTESIYPSKIQEDLLVFEKPVEKVKALRLELPLDALGGTGSINWQIPRGLIQR